jgi:hypothetical protein
MKIYLTLIRPVVTYASETWAVNEQEKKGLHILERQIRRKIFGPLRTGRVRSNAQLDRLINGADIVRFIEVQG